MISIQDLNLKLSDISDVLRKSLRLKHLFSLIDDNALLQHSKFSVPARREGYTVDDNARALVLFTRAERLLSMSRISGLQQKLISFLLFMQEEDGRIHNLMDFSHRIIDDATVGDHVGRVVWAAGTVVNSRAPPGIKSSARLIFDRALPWARSSTSPRTKAYACLGIAERVSADPQDNNLRSNLKELADTLVSLHLDSCTRDWNWFENTVTYDNPRLSQALLAAHQCLGHDVYFDVAERTLRFLEAIETIDELHAPIGNRGWYVKGGKRAVYDQQPIEAGAMIEATVMARAMGDSNSHQKNLRKALGWFLGQNTKKVALYDNATGACCDGITPEGLNENQGAESTLAFLLASESIVNSFQHRTTKSLI